MAQNKISIATWNANGVLNKKLALELFLKTKNIDVCLLSETHMTRQSKLKIVGFTCYNASHPSNKPRGGSAILVKNSLLHHEECKIETDEFQLSVIRVKSLKQDFNIGALYCPPNYNIKNMILKDLLNRLGDRFILGGDYNAKHIDWGSRLTSTRGRELRKAIRELGCYFHSTGEPTYWPTDTNKTPDLLDFFITKKISPNFISLENNQDLDSDHSAVVLNLHEKIVKKQNKPTLVNKSTNWFNFKQEIENNINLRVKITTKDEIDLAIENLNKIVQNAAWNNTNECKYMTAGSNYPRDILNAIKVKRRARRRWQETRDPADKTVLNRITQNLKRRILEIKNKSYEKYVENLSAKKERNYSLWKATKSLKKPIVPVPPIRKMDGKWAKNNKEKAETFADHLEEIFRPNEIESDLYIENDFRREENAIELITHIEMVEEIKALKSKKAPGFDLITADILKQLPKKGITMLTYIMNAMLRLNYVPNVWKVAEIIMILKPGKPPNETKSYRPISLLPIMSKLFEKLLLKRLKPIIENRKLIPNYQFGFREKHSTVDQVHRITDIIEKALEEKQICSTIFLDVAQAFDKVWHEGLIYKLRQLLPKKYVDILSSYLTDRLFRIKQDEEYSTLREIKAGVPQGSILGPILYLLYTSDLPQFQEITVATFADDTAIMAVGSNVGEATNKLQKASDKLYLWTKRWKIKLNELKSVQVNFTNKPIQNPPAVKLNGVDIPHENKAKYLGMTLDVKLKWKEHVKKKRIELEQKYREMYWLLGRKSKLPIEYKILLYNQIIKPIWLYGIQLYGCAKRTHIQRIQTFQNKVLRNMVSAPWYVRNSDLHRDLEIPIVSDEIKKYAIKHKTRLEGHINIEASKLLLSSNINRRLKRTRPLQLAINSDHLNGGL